MFPTSQRLAIVHMRTMSERQSECSVRKRLEGMFVNCQREPMHASGKGLHRQRQGERLLLLLAVHLLHQNAEQSCGFQATTIHPQNNRIQGNGNPNLQVGTECPENGVHPSCKGSRHPRCPICSHKCVCNVHVHSHLTNENAITNMTFETKD